MSDLEVLADMVTKLTMLVDGLSRREADAMKDMADIKEALKYLAEVIETIKTEDLNRDVRLGLIEGRLDGVDKG
jgi:hypothetical protein